jgi:RecA/RadA recombinase
MARKVKKTGEVLQVGEEGYVAVSPPPRDPKLRAFEKLVKGLEDWRPARDVLRAVRAVPTIFPSFDRATRVGGYPLDRFCVVHGPTSHGKSSFALGLGKSFLARGHMFAFVDAEMTTPIEWCEGMIGAELASSPAFVALRPKTYEETVDSVRSLVKKLAKARDDGELPEGTSCLVVVDSLRKLVPQNIWEKLKKSSEEVGVDGMGGRAGQIKAAMNAAWLDELTPLLYHTGTGLLAIEREREDGRDRRGNVITKMGGGQSVEFESSMTVRVTRSYVYEGSGEDSSVVGEKHELMIRKSKVAGLDEKVSWGCFHTSNGALTPAGFDRARDVLELAREFGMVEGSGWLSWKKRGTRWQGVNKAVAALTADAAQLAEMEAQVRAGFATEKA